MKAQLKHSARKHSARRTHDSPGQKVSDTEKIVQEQNITVGTEERA
jgi:hypothetical protein